MSKKKRKGRILGMTHQRAALLIRLWGKLFWKAFQGTRSTKKLIASSHHRFTSVTLLMISLIALSGEMDVCAEKWEAAVVGTEGALLI